ncbi:hypothetical protein Tco_0163198 [Tanacetum coccineum]
MNTKVGESKLSDISIVRDFIDVFPEDLSMTTTTTSGVPHRFGSWSDTRVSYDLVIFRKEHQCRLLKRGAWSSFEVSVGITEEGEVVTYLRFIANFSKIVKPHTSLTERNQKKERVKPRRVRAMAMTIQYGVRGMILAAQSEAFKQENVPERLHCESMVQTLEDIMRECVIDFGGSYHLRIWCAPFEALYGRKCRSPVIWAGIEGSSLIGPELVQETTDKRDLFWKKGKLAPRYVRPFEILERISPVAYRLRLPKELSGDEIKVDKTLHFVEEPVEIMDREVKRLKCSRMVVVRVHLGSKRGYVLFVFIRVYMCLCGLCEIDNQSIERDRSHWDWIDVGFCEVHFVHF